MIIREATINDVDGIAKVHIDTWNTTYCNFISEEYLKSRTYEEQARKWNNRVFNNTDTKEFIYVVENDDGEIVGFASGSINTFEEEYDSTLYTIYILKDHQRQGIGHRLFKAVSERLKRQGAKYMVVWAFSENKSSKFYEDLGGKLIDKKIVVKGNNVLEEVSYLFEL
ncbi:GNAT family N-acetyltransferase [Candidatus Clostridium radicumherbarum]|uniref:GNAT family N-acetyltransferase n=1 Tax=Candidatus Clostridium radicumherbarum TaxID=3381662 RepID=A0ABW8U2K7_9CLOT